MLFRSAAYLEARARLDARKTSRNVHCNPPNVRCGNRCIPPSWDCRLKGEGPDPHLRAVKTDPLGGLANIQRGASRISRGIVRGNFSEVEGGKRAIIRGAVKVTPGNLQQKKELQKKLEDRTRAIGIGLAVVTGGLGIHALLMKSNTFGYRDGVGANINNSVRLGVSRVLDATPIVGANRARVRASVQAGIEAQLQRQANPVESVLTGQLARTTPAQADIDARSKLVTALQAVNDNHRGAASSFDAWNKEHQRVFFNTTKRESGVGLGPKEEGNVFARPATDEFLARQFNLQGDDTLTSKSVKDAVQRQLTDYKSSLLDLAQQQGFSVTNTRNGRAIADKDQRAFIQGVVSSTLPRGQASPTVRSALTKHLEETLSLSPKGRTDALYRETYKGFDDYYKAQGSIISDVAGSARMTRALRATGAEETMFNGTTARSQFLLGLTRPGQQVQGPAHAELVLRDYHAAVTGTGPRRMYAVTDRLAVAAASEMEGRTVTKREAFQVLEREGFTRAVPARTATSSAPRSMTEGEAVYALMRQNPGMTLQAARREVKRRRGDTDDWSPELVRTATYLAARADFQERSHLGKPCGASHIPKAHECRKGQSTTAPSPEPGAPQRGLGKKIALAAVIGAVGAVAVTVGLDARKHFNATDFPYPQSYRAAIRAAQDGNPKMPYDVAIGKHYDKVVETEGWKPGQLVYTRFGSNSTKKDPNAHFAVYMGKNGDSHQFADLGVVKGSTRESEIYLYEYGPGNKGVIPAVFAKAPPLKGSPSPYSPEEIQQRVFSSLGSRLKYDALDNNCETWARMITTGVPRSVQTERLSRLTRSLYREFDRRQRGAPIKTLPSVKQQARILDYQARMASGDKGARAELKAFQALIKAGKRTDAATEHLSDLPTPQELLRPATSDIDALIRVKLYLMLLISTLSAGIDGRP